VGGREVAKSKVDWATQELILDWIFTVARYSTVTEMWETEKRIEL
jgi:hypothetical protein